LKQILPQAKDDAVGSYLLETAGLATGDVDLKPDRCGYSPLAPPNPGELSIDIEEPTP
jgi:hypothetical protein